MQELDVAVLINNVGIAGPPNWEIEGTYDCIAGNCYPIVLMTQQFVSKMKERFTKKGARSLIVNLSSQTALTPIPFSGNYSGAKLFDHFISRALYYELRFKGVDVVSVMPGLVATPMT